MSRPLVLLAAALALAALPPAGAEPVALSPSQDAEAELVALSLHGNATCTTSLCAAASGTGVASAGCRNATACDDSYADCSGFLCLVVAASPLGDATPYAYCRAFGQACVGAGLDQDPEAYYCRGDASGAVYCEGLA